METKDRLQVGIDVGKNKVDLAFLAPGGELLQKHRSFANSAVGYSQARALLLEVLRSHAFEGGGYCRRSHQLLLAAFL